MSDSVRPHRRKPTRLPRSQDSPGKNTGVGCHFLLQCMKVKSEREVAQSCLILSDPSDHWKISGFSRQEYWSGVPLPSPSHTARKWHFSQNSILATHTPATMCPSCLHQCFIKTSLLHWECCSYVTHPLPLEAACSVFLTHVCISCI